MEVPYHQTPEGRRGYPRVYQLADVFGRTDIVEEVARDLQFEKRLERLSQYSRKATNRAVACG